MAEPAGLNLSLEEIIRRRSEQAKPKQGGGKGSNRASAQQVPKGLDKPLGGISKPQGNYQHKAGGHAQRGGYHQRGSRQGQGFQQGGRGFQPGQGRHGSGNNYRQQQPHQKQQFQQQHRFRQPQQYQNQQQNKNWEEEYMEEDVYEQPPAPRQPRVPAAALQQPRVAAQPPVQIVQQPVEYAPPQCMLNEDTGDVVVSIEDFPIVVVAPNGEMMLDSGGYYDDQTLAGMNEVLNLIGMRVFASGPVENGVWSVTDGATLKKYEDGMVIPSRGNYTKDRGTIILAAFQSPHARFMALRASAASTAAAVAAGILPSQLPAAAAAAAPRAVAPSMAAPAPAVNAAFKGPGGLRAGAAAFQPAGAGAGMGKFGHAGMQQQQQRAPPPQQQQQGGLSADMARRLRAQGRF